MIKKTVRIFLEDGKIKLVCLLVSVVLWSFVKSLKISAVKINVPLRLESLPDKLVLTSAVPRFVTLEVRGEKEDLRFSTSDLRTTIDLSGIKQGFHTLTPDFDEAQLPNKVELVSKSKIKLTLEKVSQKQLWVKASLKGNPHPGYQVGQVMVSPKRVVVNGPASKLKGIYEVYTKDVSVENLKKDVERIVPLVEPNSMLSFAGQDAVQLSARIYQKDSKDKKILEDVPVKVVNLDPAYSVTLDKKEINIYLRGNQAILEEVGVQDLNAFINLNKITPNTVGGEQAGGPKQNSFLLIPVEAELSRFQGKVFVVETKPSELRVNFSKLKKKPKPSDPPHPPQETEPSSQ